MTLWAICLRWGLKWSKAENLTWRRIAYATFFANFIAPLVTLYVIMLGVIQNPLLDAGLYLFLVLGLTICSLMILFRLNFGKSFQAWLPTLLASFASIGIAHIYKAYAFEAFNAPTNSMAPTILGDHALVKCPICGKPAFGSIHPGMRIAIPHHIICEDFHISEEGDLLRSQPDVVEEIEQHGLHERDRFVAAKYLTPKRWDLITFRYPEEPGTLYIKRLIGLPGETIVIRDGAVYANNKKLEPPAELRGLKYESDAPYFSRETLSGSEQRPAVLGPDEYFVLGDFTAAASDSRYWQKGAPGHPPYAVPADYITGVVTHRFWPLHRMHRFEEH
jgi:signal peptidase I